MKTEKIVAAYTLTEAAYRPMVALAAGPVARNLQVEVPVGALTSAARLALLDLGLAGQEAPRVDMGERDEAPDCASVSTELVARGLAKAEREAQRLLGEMMDEAKAEDTIRYYEAHPECAQPLHSGAYASDLHGCPRYLEDRLRAVLAKRRSIDKAAAEARAAEKAVVVAAEAVERADWIRAHGSERLKLALQLGQPTQGYDSERLAIERPGWEWDSDGVDGEPRSRPDLEALQALAAARKGVTTEAELSTIYPECKNDCPAGCTEDSDDDYSGHTHRYVLRAEYRGGKIRKILHEVK